MLSNRSSVRAQFNYLHALAPNRARVLLIMNGALNAGQSILDRISLSTATLAARGLQIVIIVVVLSWVLLLGGLGFAPNKMEGGGNDTGPVFNWHPLLMSIAFVICMGEAVLAYKSPILRLEERAARKAWHFAMHSAALAIGTLGILAAVKSHNLKLPDPIPNFYSTHSYLGLLVCALFFVQYALGASAFLAPKWSQSNRAAFVPVHGFIGLVTFSVGIATMAVGIQEKTTFVQFGTKASIGSAVMRIPAVLQLILTLYAAIVVWLHACARNGASRSQLGPFGYGDRTTGAAQSLSIDTEPLYPGH